jgi:hypothetical protein
MKHKFQIKTLLLYVIFIISVIQITSCTKEVVQVATVLPVPPKPPKPPTDCSVYFYREDDFAIPAYEGEVLVTMNNLTGSLDVYFNTGRGPTRCSSFGH